MWDVIFFCGFCVVICCKLLDEIGGIVVEIVIEDVYIFLWLYCCGYIFAYMCIL